MAVRELKFVQFQVLPETESWRAELYALDDTGQLWVQRIGVIGRSPWTPIDQNKESEMK